MRALAMSDDCAGNRDVDVAAVTAVAAEAADLQGEGAVDRGVVGDHAAISAAAADRLGEDAERTIAEGFDKALIVDDDMSTVGATTTWQRDRAADCRLGFRCIGRSTRGAAAAADRLCVDTVRKRPWVTIWPKLSTWTVPPKLPAARCAAKRDIDRQVGLAGFGRTRACRAAATTDRLGENSVGIVFVGEDQRPCRGW